jgi:hypothetical protein
MTRRNQGNTLVGLLLLLLIIGGAGAWNYHRNAAIEDQEYRPYRTHSDEALQALIDAYESERDSSRKAYMDLAGERTDVRSKAMLDEQVAEFERIQTHGNQARAARDVAAGLQVSLKELKKEQARRAVDADGFARILRLATTF